MNKNILILLALLSFCFACNNSSDEALADTIIGDWDIHSFIINSCPDAADNVPLTLVDENGCVEVFGAPLCMSVSFNRDGTGSFITQQIGNVGDGMSTFEYTIDGETNTVNTISEWGNETIFSFRDNQLSLEMDEEGCICAFSFES